MANELDITTIEEAVQYLRPLAKQVKAVKNLDAVLNWVAGNKKVIQNLEHERHELDAKMLAWDKEKASKQGLHDKELGQMTANAVNVKAQLARDLTDMQAVQAVTLDKLNKQVQSQDAKLRVATADAADARSKLATADADWKKRERELDALHEQQAERRTKELAKLEHQIGQVTAELHRLTAKFAVG